ncbi:uncharacterized protein METZ01_LOCUS457032 [marine metagenome]|uniref:Uncharacterized protein n=1 Tax=marine metagenome TaxID=408172 RepID=A0A383AAR3_9ZZZZ
MYIFGLRSINAGTLLYNHITIKKAGVDSSTPPITSLGQ